MYNGDGKFMDRLPYYDHISQRIYKDKSSKCSIRGADISENSTLCDLVIDRWVSYSSFA
uniref:Uncharacterized protein n=1 Tax=Arion vulgaris TaxID=1028688 RepID=A0A0B6ZDI5_9EUPU